AGSGRGGNRTGGAVPGRCGGDGTGGGRGSPAESAVQIVLDTPRVQVTADKLKALPFVPAKVWQEVMAEGTTPVRFTLDFTTEKAGTHYKVELEPTDTTVHVSSIDLDADQASGKLVVEDELVQLRDVKGRVKGRKGASTGKIETGGDLDFRPTPSVLDLTVAVAGVPLHDLPEKWGLPKEIDGRLT